MRSLVTIMRKQDVSQENLQLKRLSTPSPDKVEDKLEFSHKLQLNTKQSKSLGKILFTTKHVLIQWSNNPASGSAACY